MILLLAALGMAAAIPAARPASASDLRDYAIASCLVRQTASAPMREEGYRLASIVLSRAGVDPFAWKPLQAAVDETLGKQGLLMVHVDGPVAQSTRAVPLASCLQVIDAPSVRGAMARLARMRRR